MSRNHTPPRVQHMLPPALLADYLSPSYAKVNNRIPDEVWDEVKKGLASELLHAALCTAIWKALCKEHPGRDEATLLDHLASALARKTGARTPAATKGQLERMTAFFAAIDLSVGRAGDAARRAFETEPGQRMLQKSIETAAEFLVSRW
jgi:hypothetical protein